MKIKSLMYLVVLLPFSVMGQIEDPLYRLSIYGQFYDEEFQSNSGHLYIFNNHKSPRENVRVKLRFLIDNNQQIDTNDTYPCIAALNGESRSVFDFIANDEEQNGTFIIMPELEKNAHFTFIILWPENLSVSYATALLKDGHDQIASENFPHHKKWNTLLSDIENNKVYPIQIRPVGYDECAIALGHLSKR